MLGSRVGETLNAAFAALSAQVLHADRSQGSLLLSISESQEYLDCSNNKSCTKLLDHQCHTFNSQGLSKLDKITLTNVAMFKPSDNVNKWLGTIWAQLLLHQGGTPHSLQFVGHLKLCQCTRRRAAKGPGGLTHPDLSQTADLPLAKTSFDAETLLL